MNLIELSEQLKDVPDQLLMKEVQAPSGAYPSYLVVTEMSRRKRMRDQAQKEAPTTTVAQDLAQPSREQMMAAMAATQQRMGQQTPPPSQLVSGQGPQGPQAQMMSQPAPRLNAGIMAAPQAANALSAQDVMAAEEPRRMAGGGMVAFAKGGDIHYDDRGAVRFQNQGAVPRYGMRFEELPEYRNPPASSLGELFGNMFTRPGQRIDPVTGDPIYIAEFLRRQEAERAAAAAPVARAIVENAARANPQAAINIAQTDPTRAAEMAQRIPEVAAHLRNAGVNTGQQNPPAAPAAAPGTSGPRPAGQSNVGFRLPTVNLGSMPTLSLTPITDPYAAEAKDLSARFAATREPTAEEAAASRKRGGERYAQEMPFRYGFLEKDIAKREKDIEGRRASNINEALIQTGLGIMGSKSPRFLQAAGEAGTAGLNAYRQGLKDIREGEKDILQSKTAFANAQTLYDQGKFAAGDKEEEKANARYERGLTRLNTESAILARNQNASFQQAQLRQQGELGAYTAGLNAYKTQMEAQKLPYEMNVLREQAGYYSRAPGSVTGAAQNRITDADQRAAEEAARMRALMSGNKFGTPEYQNAFNTYYAEELQRRAAGVNYNPQAAPQGGPRVQQQAPGALPPGWSVQVK